MRTPAILAVLAALAACSEEPQAGAAPSTAPAPDAAAAPAPEDEFFFEIDGPQIYADFCEDCHGADGEGVPDVNPPLAGSELVGGDPADLIHFMLTLEYPEPREDVWSGGMGAVAYLSDEEVAAVVTYIRERFADVGEVTAEDVAAVRQ